MTSVVSSSVPFIDLPHVTKAQGTVTLPGSKSISNRVLLLAALAEGTTTLHGVLESDDTRVMLEALRQLGVPLEVNLAQRSAQITGIGAQIRARGFPQQTADIYLGNAGTAFRPLTAVLACLPGNYYLHGVPRMHERPIADLVTALQEAGAQIEYLQNPGYPPLRIQTAAQGWQHRLQVPGNVSSQFLTALLLAAPLLTAQQALEISVVGELISQPYIAITLDLMRRFGVEVENHDWKKFIVPAQAFYQSPETFWIEGDASSASYFFALGLLGQGPITVQGVGHDSIQGDMQFAHWLTTLGADIEWHPNQLTIQRAHSLREKPLPAFRLDALLIPDAAMTAAVLALFADGPCTIENIASWRVKETDRIAAMQTELRRLGAEVHSTADSITIHPIAPKDWRSAAIATYDDHRMAMCFSLAAFGSSAIRVLDPDCVAKTFPEYFAEYAALVHTVPPVITIDGPTASGKGTLAARVAERLGFQVLDSGALYRLTALACTQQGIAQDAESDIALIAAHLKVRFEDQRIWLNGEEVTEAIRAEAIGNMASSIAAYPSVRAALLERQIAFQQPPGLVADGRDMGTVVFPHAFLKIFVEASAEVRAERRYRQLSDRGLKADYSAILADLQARDRRDRERTVAPLAPASDAYVLDTSHLSIEDAVEHILSCYNKKLLMQPH